MNLRGANVLITGGAHRLGRAIALRLAAEGANLAINYHRSAAAAEETCADALRQGVRCITVAGDAAEGNAVAAMAERVETELGRLDLWVANAGIFRRTPFADVDAAGWDEMWRGNFLTFARPAAVIAPLLRRRGGCIVAIADVAAQRPWADHLPYSVAKSSVVALARRLAIDLAPAVRVNAIAPGPVLFPTDFPADQRRHEVERTLLRREGGAENIAAAVVELATNDYVTGALYPVDGGRLLT
jgi:pteridine reductase